MTLSQNSPIEVLMPQEHPDVVFAVIGPAGADLDNFVCETLKAEIAGVGYQPYEIRLSKLIEKFYKSDYSGLYADERIENLMRDGTDLRELVGRGDAVALLAASEIREIRKSELKNSTVQKAYVLNSLKHPAEIATLRNIYGTGFFCVSIYSPRDERVNDMAEFIAKSRAAGRDRVDARAKAEEIIGRDEEEHGKKLGQNVAKVFPDADVFVDSRSRQDIKKAVARFVEMVFDNPFHTPSKDEHGMYHAKSASLRSADLGRQVGAAVMTPEGDVISVGCNDTPKAGGGLYWDGDVPDYRDFQKGSDISHTVKEQIYVELLGNLNKHGWLAEPYAKEDLAKLVRDNLDGESAVFDKTQISQLLEYGRSVHAEMAALMDAARRGVSVQGSTLYSTTFPCHMCARHIVAAGIARLVYIDPYPKSKAKFLHDDAITVDHRTRVGGKVNFEPFVGLAPRQYMRMFEMHDNRKDKSGNVREWKRAGAKPRVSRYRNTYLDIETTITGEVIPKMIERRDGGGK